MPQTLWWAVQASGAERPSDEWTGARLGWVGWLVGSVGWQERVMTARGWILRGGAGSCTGAPAAPAVCE